jgi:fucose 4-O-acetylase-like acetyltransferase
MSKRILSLDLAKGIAIILIVWAHADFKMNVEFYQTYLKVIHEAIYSFHIPLFFMISGILSNFALSQNNFKMREYTKHLCDHTLIPFYTWSFIFLIINLAVPSSFIRAPSLKEMSLSLIYMQSHPDFLPSGVLWFFFTLFMCAFIHAIALKWLKINRFVWLGITLIATLFSTYLWDIYFFSLDRICRNLFFYVLGYLISGFIYPKSPLLRGKAMVLALSVWLVAFYPFYHGDFLWRIFTGTAGSILVLGIAYRTDTMKPTIFIQGIRFIGKRSIEIFVFHSPLLLLTFKVLKSINLLNSFSGLVIACFVGVGGSLLIGRIIEVFPFAYLFLFRKHPHPER